MLVVAGSAWKHVVYFATLPLRVLYFHGPRLGGYGFQEGVRMEDACEHFTSVRSEFWAGTTGASDECNEILERKFNAFVVGWCALLLAGMGYQYLQFHVARRVVSPTMKRLDDILSYLRENNDNKR